jgi:hypothetical protein
VEALIRQPDLIEDIGNIGNIDSQEPLPDFLSLGRGA